MRHTVIITVTFIALAACNKDSGAATTAPEPAVTAQAGDATDADAAPATATEPDQDKLALHIREHLELPADRAKVLEACANTPEFTEGEKLWIADHLPEGNYESPEEVLAAIGVSAE